MQAMNLEDLLADVMAAPGDFVYFKARVPLRHLSIGTKHWRYYDFGPKTMPPLVCLSGIAGTAEVFYKIILSLTVKGYRVIAADAPPVWTPQEWISSFEKFMDLVGVHHVHLYGTGLGGFLAQLFAQQRPRRVKSLLLSNTFLDTRQFASNISWSPLISWTPEFILKRYILSGIRDVPQEPLIADSIDFVVAQIETLSRQDLASRLTLNTCVTVVGQIMIPDSSITIMDTNDYCAVPQDLKDEVTVRYPDARKALLKSGGDFPFLSRADEVSLHAQLHLRRAGVEGVAEATPISPSRKDDDGDGDGDGDDGDEGGEGEEDDGGSYYSRHSKASTSPADKSFSPKASDSFQRLSSTLSAMAAFYHFHCFCVMLLFVDIYLRYHHHNYHHHHHHHHQGLACTFGV